MQINELHDQKAWNELLLSQPTQAGIFLQSWEWLEFQKALGRKVWRLGISTAGQQDNRTTLVGVCGLAKYDLPMGKSYLYALRGPVLGKISNSPNYLISNEIAKYIKTLAEEESSIFWRLEPIANLDVARYMLHATRPIQPEQTLVCDLSTSEDELLSAMHEKTRYNIRLALRKGVELRTTSYSLPTFNEFWKMFQETAKRDGFTTHERKYYETLLAVLHNSPQPSPGLRPPSPAGRGEGENHEVMRVRLYMAYASTTPIAGAIVGYFGDTATYLFGASSYEHRAYMGPYGLHWTIMREAKQQGYRFYDFWGTDTKGAASAHGRDWSGITRFKMGFGGKLIEYPGTFDLSLNRFWYTVYRLARRVL